MARFDDDGKVGGMTPWIPAFLLPFATAGVALVGGLVLGGAGMYVLRPADVRVEPRDMTSTELDSACQPVVAKVTEELDKANNQVTQLVGEVKVKEARVHELEDEMKKRGAAGTNLKKQLDHARAELAEAKKQLKVAIAEKEQLVAELKSALVDLDAQKVRTLEAKQEAWDNGFQAFVNAGQLEICERGSRKKLGRCREAVVDVLQPMKDQYQYCLRTGQAVPSLQEAEKRQEDIPRFARWLDQDNRVLKGWYIQMCDPSLPEAKDYASVQRNPDQLEPVPTPPPAMKAEMDAEKAAQPEAAREPTKPSSPLLDMRLPSETRLTEDPQRDQKVAKDDDLMHDDD